MERAKMIPSTPKRRKNDNPNPNVRIFCIKVCFEYDIKDFLPKSSPMANVLIT